MFLLSLFFLTTYLKIRYMWKKNIPLFQYVWKTVPLLKKNLLYFCNCCILLILKSYYLLLHEKEKNQYDWWMMNDRKCSNIEYKSWNTGFKYNQLFSLHLFFINYISIPRVSQIWSAQRPVPKIWSCEMWQTNTMLWL